MSDPLVVLVLMGSASAEPTADAMMTATRAALGPDAVILTDASSQPRSDAEAADVARRVGAGSVVRVVWSDGARSVRLRIHVEPSAEWIDEQIEFSASDAAAERGRTVGFALASMVQRLEREREASVAPPPPPPPAPPPVVEAPTMAAPLAGGKDRPRTTPRPTAMVDVFASALASAAASEAGAGASGGAWWWPLPRLGLRASAGVRVGSIDAAAASSTMMVGTAGVGYRVPVGRGFELGARADVLIQRWSVTRTAATETTRSRWIGGADLLAEVVLALGTRTAVVAGVGGEAVFGTTEVVVGGRPVAPISPLRAVGELGGRFRF